MRFTALFTRDSPSVPAIQKAARDLSRPDPDAFPACHSFHPLNLCVWEPQRQLGHGPFTWLSSVFRRLQPRQA